MTEKPLVSVAIPAYNKPAYTRKTLKSIIKQTYRPIEIILSDDKSPESLEFLIDEIAHYQDENLIIKFFRQEKNQGPVNNIKFASFKSTGKYKVLMPHDDWFTDQLFLQESVDLMEMNSDCNICFANSILERPKGKKLNDTLPDFLNAESDWKIIEGDDYIGMLENEIKYHAYSGVIYNWEVLKKMGGYQYPFCLDETITKQWDILPDEGYCFAFLLSSIGSIAITNKVVSVRGMPPDSYSKTASWSKVVGQALFMLMYNIYIADLKGKYSKAVRKKAKELIFRWPVEKINLKILRHYRYNPNAVYLMIRSYLINLDRKIKYVRYMKRMQTIVKNGHYSEFNRLYRKFRHAVKEHGLFWAIKRIFIPFY